MSKNLKILIAVLILLLIGFILFLIYRPDIETPKSEDGSKLIIYHAIDYKGISDFFPDNKADQLVEYTNINIAYNEEHEQAQWVCYLLTKVHIQNPICKRNNKFKSDPNIQTYSAEPKDYYKSGFDRGHLAPAADMLWSEQAMKESFYMSNMSPQKASFNRGVWKKLENRVRKLVLLEDSLVIITGPLLNDTMGSIGKNKVSVPSKFFKIIIDISSPKIGAVAFVIPNRGTKLPLNKFAISIDSLEQLSKLNFMEALDDGIEIQLEKTIDESILDKLNQ
jgi:endonuclease G